MVKLRMLILLSTVLIVGTIAGIAILFARGFRLEKKQDGSTIQIAAKGLLVVNSEPTGAQVFIDDTLQTATNNTITLDPGSHAVSVRKEGFLEWHKTLEIQKEVVNQINAYLLPSAPSLTALSFSGVINPQVSPDFTKIVYAVPANKDETKGGLWMYETTNLPLGFGRDPQRITNADLSTFSWEWSPDARNVLVASKSATYLLPVATYTESKQLVNVSSQVQKIKSDWKVSKNEKTVAQLAKLDLEVRKVFQTSTNNIVFSPDETKILYTATASATIPTGVVKELPGSSSQIQARTIKPHNSYIYDIKEDRNFLLDDTGNPVYWVQNSLNVVIPDKDKIVVADYDGTNKATVYSGNYQFPYAFPTTSTSKMVILTSFGATGTLPNLYWLSLK
jgi:hypothetical protein